MEEIDQSLQGTKSEKMVLKAEDLEYAINLLSAEKRPERNLWALLKFVVTYLCFGGMVVGFLGGLLVIWFDRTIAPYFFYLCAISAVLYFPLVLITILAGSVRKSELESKYPDLYKTVRKYFWRPASPASGSWVRDCLTGMVPLIGIILMISGCAWTVIGLVQSSEIKLPALLMWVLPFLLFCGYVGYDEYREMQYYSTVAKLLKKLEDRPGEEIIDQEVKILANIESKRLQQAVQQAEIEKKEQTLYGVLVRPGVLEGLQSQQVSDIPAWKILQELTIALQKNPRPEGVTLLPGEVNVYAIQKEKLRISYRVDDEQRRAEILDWQPDAGAEGGDHG
jgi:hypothetical protein